MQKGYSSLILAVVIVVASPVNAETVIFGRLHSSQTQLDSAEDKGSRFRLENPEELGSGLRALFELEWQVDTGRVLSSRNQQLDNRQGYLERNLGPSPVGWQGTRFYNSASEIDVWDVSIDYHRGPHTIGTSLSNYREYGLENRELWGAATRYRYSDFALTAQYEYDPEPALDKSHEWSLVGEYYLGDNVLHARYSDIDWDDDTDPHWTLGLKHRFNKRTSFYAEFQNNDSDAEQLYGAGIRHNF